LETRARISENLAVQLANLAGQNDAVAIKDTIDSIVKRNSELLSIGIRGLDGKLLVDSGDHASHWIEPTDGKSTATHLQIPLLNGEAPRGKIEMAFRPLAAPNNILGFSRTMIGLIGFISVAGMTGYYFILKRALREFDLSHAIPERVKAAFDTLAEGVLIMDEREIVLLANDAFVKNIYGNSQPLLGVRASDLPWVQSSIAAANSALPWQIAILDGQSILGIPMGIHNQTGALQRFLVNATRIVDGKGIVRGVIATFDDITVLHQTNEQLNISIDQLHISQMKISTQNQQLQLLASSDPLTGCLNRRTFFAEAELRLQNALGRRDCLSLLMLDADHFKSVNDRFGHVVGDKVLVGLVEVMQQTCREGDLVGRYGGEEFCILATRRFEQEIERLADRMREAVARVTTWLPNGECVTVSIGIASLTHSQRDIADLVKRADEALYAAKATGRNRFVNWGNMPPLTQAAMARRTSLDSNMGLYAAPIANETSGLPPLGLTPQYIDAIIQGDKGGRHFAIVCIALDNFGYFNDRHGRDVGDALLAEIGQRITKRFRRTDKLAHINNDEFLLLLDPFESKDQIESIVERILEELKRPFSIEGFELFSSCSVSVSVYPEHGRTYAELRKNADCAMYRAKRSSQGKAVYFDFNMTLEAAARMEAEQRLRLAIQDRKLCCAFQPKVDLRSEQVVGFEALVRWRGDDGEIHLPEEFVGLAVEIGLIGQITNFVLDTVIKSMGRLDAAFGPGTSISVNIAPKLANDADFMLPLTRTLRDSQLADRIILELTEESWINEGLFQSEILPILHELGVRVSIDDFGTGYSSLGALAHINADEIKIDRSFISEIHKRPRNQSVLRAIASLGQALGMTIVAEGVETFEELAYLRVATNIRQAQGFYFSRPFFLEEMDQDRSSFLRNPALETNRPRPRLRSLTPTRRSTANR
jgi:diguanylate cyclase (GGDEF)-like protein